MGWEEISADVDRTIRRTLYVAGAALVGLLVAAFDLGHRHARRKSR